MLLQDHHPCNTNLTPSFSTIYTFAVRQGLHHYWTEAGGQGKGYHWDEYAGAAGGPFLSFLQLILEQAGEVRNLEALRKSAGSALSTA